MRRDEEYQLKRERIKDWYLAEICNHEDAGEFGDAENARRWCHESLRRLEEQYRNGEEMTGMGTVPFDDIA